MATSIIQTRFDVGTESAELWRVDPEDRIFYPVISDISVALRETTLTISDSIETDSPVETELVRVDALGTTKMTNISRFKKTIFREKIH